MNIGEKIWRYATLDEWWDLPRRVVDVFSRRLDEAEASKLIVCYEWALQAQDDGRQLQIYFEREKRFIEFLIELRWRYRISLVNYDTAAISPLNDHEQFVKICKANLREIQRNILYVPELGILLDQGFDLSMVCVGLDPRFGQSVEKLRRIGQPLKIYVR